MSERDGLVDLARHQAAARSRHQHAHARLQHREVDGETVWVALDDVGVCVVGADGRRVAELARVPSRPGAVPGSPSVHSAASTVAAMSR